MFRKREGSPDSPRVGPALPANAGTAEALDTVEPGPAKRPVAPSQAPDMPQDWIERADRALDAAKSGGRDRVETVPTDSGPADLEAA